MKVENTEAVKEDSWLIYISGRGYYTGKCFYKNNKGTAGLHAQVTSNPNAAKSYRSYGSALIGVKALKRKCEPADYDARRLSECVKENSI